MGSKANIRSPEVLQRFRHRFLEFNKSAQTALELIQGDVRSVSEWLRREQLPYWRRELRRRQDAVKDAWRDYVYARHGHGSEKMGKPSCVDERKALERAKRRKEEAERKIEIVERWRIALDREAEKLLAPCTKLRILLDDLAPKAVARLDHMLDRLEEYLMPAAPRPPADTPKSPKE